MTVSNDLLNLPKTCGLIVVSPEGWLLGKVSALNYWDLPKGKMDPNETPQETAVRECFEEMGLDFSSFISQFEDLGEMPYNTKRGKRLHLFRLTLDHSWDLSGCKSTPIEKNNGEVVFEMDDWQWIKPEHVLLAVNRRMGKHLRKRDLLNGDIRPPKRVQNHVLVSETTETIGFKNPKIG